MKMTMKMFSFSTDTTSVKAGALFTCYNTFTKEIMCCIALQDVEILTRNSSLIRSTSDCFLCQGRIFAISHLECYAQRFKLCQTVSET